MIPSGIIIMVSIALICLAIMLFHSYIYPVYPVKKGNKTNVYIDGAFNRTATITDIKPDYLTVYDKLPLPIHYRGKFYAVGRMSDGHTVMFLGKKKLYLLMRFAELIRKIMRTPEYLDQTVDDAPEMSQKEPKEGAEDEL